MHVPDVNSPPAPDALAPPVHVAVGAALASLRAATSARHARLDAGAPLARPDAGAHELLQHLQWLRPWLAPLERGLATHDSHDTAGHALPSVDRTALLDADAGVLQPGATVPADDPTVWPAGADGRDGASAAFRWGLRYVLEGSQLGGRVLHRRLSGRVPADALRYLAGAEDGVASPRWLRVVAALEHELADPVRLDPAIQGACHAFDTLLARPLPAR